MVWKIKEGEFSEIFLSELASVIESSKACKHSRSKVDVPVLENLLKLIAAKSTRVSELVDGRLPRMFHEYQSMPKAVDDVGEDSQQIPLCLSCP